jgi:methylmalonyl-CoA mutase
LDHKSANANALHQLQNGANGIVFDVRNNAGLKLSELLQDIEWSACNVSFYVPEIQNSFFENLSIYLRESKSSPTLSHGFFLQETYPHHPQSLHNVIHNLKAFTHFHLLGITSQVENPVNQISELLSQSVSLIEQLTLSGADINLVLRNLFFSVPIGTDFFIEIAKLKALRLLWFQVVQAYGIRDFKPTDLFSHVYNKSWHNSDFQPHENMLKATTASLAAILGGCNALTNQSAEEDDERLSRIARNVSNVLREEAHLNKVADPTAGSYYTESLVHSIAMQAWEKFTLTVSNV